MSGTTRGQEAAEWLVSLQHEEMTPERTAAWLEWSQADAGNLEAFEQAEALSLGLSALSDERKAKLLARYVGMPDIGRGLPKQLIYALAAGVAFLMLGVGYWLMRAHVPFAATYVTAKAENRTLELPDGSRVQLGASSQLDVNYEGVERAVTLREGEAYFTVKHNIRWPFSVRAGATHVVDIGTSFDVRKSGEHVVVSVTEGAVDVRKLTAPDAPVSMAAIPATRVRAGERLMTDGSAAAPIPVKTSAHAAAAWKPGRLDFQNEPLGVVVANVNRYARHELVIVDPQVSAMSFTGTVFEDRVEDWVAGTLHLFNLRAEPAADGRVLVYAKRAEEGSSPAGR